MPRKTGHPNCRQAVIVIVVAQLREERDILKKATAFFASQK